MKPFVWLSLVLLVVGLVVQQASLDHGWMLAAHASVTVPWSESVWSCLTVLGGGWACLVMVLSADRRDGRLILALPGALLVCGLLSYGLKRWLAVPRPAETDIADRLVIIGHVLQGTHSTPSAHAVAAGAIATLLVVFGGGRCRTFGICALALLVAWSRVAVGAHWPSDVLLGLALGVSGATATVCLLNAQAAEPLLQGLRVRVLSPLGQRFVALIEVASGAALLLTPTGYPLGAPVGMGLAGLAVYSAAVRVWANRPSQVGAGQAPCHCTAAKPTSCRRNPAG